MLVPAIVASGIIVFAISMDDFVISAFLSSGHVDGHRARAHLLAGPNRADTGAERARDADARAHRSSSPSSASCSGGASVRHAARPARRRRVRRARRRARPLRRRGSPQPRPRPSERRPPCACARSPAMSEHAQWIGPTGRRRSGAEAREAADAERRGVRAARPLLRRPVGLDVVGRLERRRADDTSPSPRGRARGARSESSRPGELGLLAREERAEHADRRRGRRVVVQLAHELVRARSPRRRARPRARTARRRRRGPSSRFPASSPAGAAAATRAARARSGSRR